MGREVGCCTGSRERGTPQAPEDVHYRLAYKLDGTLAAEETYKRRRRNFNAAMDYAIKCGYIDRNPVGEWVRHATAQQGSIAPRILMNPVQAREFLISVSYVGSVHRKHGRCLVAFFECILWLRTGLAIAEVAPCGHLPGGHRPPLCGPLSRAWLTHNQQETVRKGGSQ